MNPSPQLIGLLRSHYHVNRKTGCWEDRTGKGWTYGAVSILRNGRKRFTHTHRIVAHLALGMDLEDKTTQVCHACDNPPCGNPKHLFLGNASKNRIDLRRKTTQQRCDLPPHFYKWNSDLNSFFLSLIQNDK